MDFNGYGIANIIITEYMFWKHLYLKKESYFYFFLTTFKYILMASINYKHPNFITTSQLITKQIRQLYVTTSYIEQFATWKSQTDRPDNEKKRKGLQLAFCVSIYITGGRCAAALDFSIAL